MSSILEKELSIFERKPSSYRMRAHDEAGKEWKKTKKQKKMKHANEDFWE